VNPDSVSHAFAEIADRAGLGGARLYDRRHGFAVALLRAGVNVKVVSEALGHSRTASRWTYTRLCCPAWASRWHR
jgi:site-specific recombinase XerD